MERRYCSCIQGSGQVLQSELLLSEQPFDSKSGFYFEQKRESNPPFFNHESPVGLGLDRQNKLLQEPFRDKRHVARKKNNDVSLARFQCGMNASERSAARR